MPDPSRPAFGPRKEYAAVRVAKQAGRQCGVVSRRQLLELGVTDAGITRAVKSGRLHRIHPGVYAVGHRALSVRGKLVAALLYAGPGAALSHLAAAWWWGFIDTRPSRIEVSALGRRSSLPDVRVHHPRRLDATRHDGLPITTAPRTLLDIAGLLPFRELRRALAEAQYLHRVDAAALRNATHRGHPGARALRRAVDRQLPQLAQTRSVLEERFLELCEAHGIPLPEVNARVAGLEVDALWREARLVVELDGHVAHADPQRIEHDRARELTLRRAGLRLRRYSWRQVVRESSAVAAELLVETARRRD